MTKKHFQALAEALAAAKQSVVADLDSSTFDSDAETEAAYQAVNAMFTATLTHLCRAFKADNPAFQEGRFNLAVAKALGA